MESGVRNQNIRTRDDDPAQGDRRQHDRDAVEHWKNVNDVNISIHVNDVNDVKILRSVNRKRCKHLDGFDTSLEPPAVLYNHQRRVVVP